MLINNNFTLANILGHFSTGTESSVYRMPAHPGKIPVELAVGIVRKWTETYQWIPIFGAIAAFAVAFSAGANNIPTAFSTPVGSGAISFLKVSLVACAIYVPGAGFASRSGVNALFSDFIRENQPNDGFLMWSMVVVLITTTFWLALATYFELPVSSQQSTQGALLGTMLVTEGFGFIPMWNKNQNHNFNGGGLLWIFLEWTVAPLIACASAFCLFSVLKTSLLRHENAEKRILIFLPIYYGITAGLLCLFIMFQVLPLIVAVYKWIMIVAIVSATFIGAILSLVVVVPLARRSFDTSRTLKTTERLCSEKKQCIEKQDPKSDEKFEEEGDDQFEEALKDFLEMRCLETVYEEEDERSWASPEVTNKEMTPHLDQRVSHESTTGHTTAFKHLLQATPNNLIQTRNFQKIEKVTRMETALKFIKSSAKSTFFPVIKYERQTLIRHALAEKFDEMEDFFGFPLLLASCIFALVQSANEIATLVSPFEAILDVFKHRSKYSGDGEAVGNLHVDWWFRALGGLSAATGFFLCGWRLTQCLGTKLTYISNSRGMASQLSAVATIIVVTRMKLPVSCVHALIGSLVGVGIADEPQNVNWRLLGKFVCGWVITIVFCCSFSYGIYSFTIFSPAFVVP